MSERDDEYEAGWSNPPSRLDSGPASWLGAPDPVESFGHTVEQALRNLSIELAGLRAERDGMRLELEGLRTQLELTQQRLADRDQFAATVRELGQIAQRLQPPGGWTSAAAPQYAPPQPQYAPPQPQYAPPPQPPQPQYAPPPAAPHVEPPPPYPTPVVHAPQVVPPTPEPAHAPIAPEPVAFIPPAPEPPAPEPVAYIPPAPEPAPVAYVPPAPEPPAPQPVAEPLAEPVAPEAPTPEPVAAVPEPPAAETARFVMPPASSPVTEPAPAEPAPTPSERAFERVAVGADGAPGSAIEAPSDNFFDQPGVWIGPPVKDQRKVASSLGTWGRRLGTGILAVVVAVVLLISVGPKVLPYQTYFVRSGSMSPTFDTGDMIFLTKTEAADIKERDIITFERPDQPGTLVTHRVTAIETGEQGKQFQTKGDANNEPDAWRVPATGTGWKYKFRVAKLGYVFGYLGSPAARLALLAIPAVLLGVLSLIDIWKPQQSKARRKR